MLKKVVIFLGMVLVLSTFLAGCGTKEQSGKKEDKTYTIKLAYVVPETQSTHIAAKEVFKKYV